MVLRRIALSKTRNGSVIPRDVTTASPDSRIRPVISVKSPFSHKVLFGFMTLYHLLKLTQTPKMRQQEVESGKRIWFSGQKSEGERMPRKGHTEEQIMRALREAEGGKKTADICREMGVWQQAF